MLCLLLLLILLLFLPCQHVNSPVILVQYFLQVFSSYFFSICFWLLVYFLCFIYSFLGGSNLQFFCDDLSQFFFMCQVVFLWIQVHNIYVLYVVRVTALCTVICNVWSLFSFSLIWYLNNYEIGRLVVQCFFFFFQETLFKPRL